MGSRRDLLAAGSTLPLTTSEDSLQRMIITQAHGRGWLVAHFLPATRHGVVATHMDGDNGFPDLVLAKNGVVLHREVKSHAGRLRPTQKDWLNALGPGETVGTWRPGDWRRIIAELDGAA